MSTTPRLVFAGTPEFAAQHLSALLASELPPMAVYTQPDRPAGRGRKIQASAVKQVAEAAGIPVYQPVTLKTPDVQDELRALAPDLLIVVAYGLLLPQTVLDIPKFGCINVHASLLPRWRGAAPIQRAVEAGDEESGVTIMQMEAGLDTGPMLLKATCPLASNETSQSLHDKLATLGAQTLPVAVTKLLAGQLVAEVQDDAMATHAAKLNKAEGRINWHENAELIDRKVRAYTPWPGSQCQLEDTLLKCKAQIIPGAASGSDNPGTIIKADTTGLVVTTGQGQILITHLQFPGKRMSAIADLLNAYADKLAPGQRFQ